VGGGDEGRHQRRGAGDLGPVDGRGKRGARPDVSCDHHEAAGERGSGEEAAAARECRLERRDEWHERESGEEADEDRGHDAAAVVGEVGGQLSGRRARGRQDTLDEVGGDQQYGGRRSAQGRQPGGD
jgi:hypothetical protein